MDFVEAKGRAGAAIAACVPRLLASHVRVQYADRLSQDHNSGTWLLAGVTGPMGIGLRLRVRVDLDPPVVELLPVA